MNDLKVLYNYYTELKTKPRRTKREKDNFKILELALLRRAIDKLLKEVEA